MKIGAFDTERRPMLIAEIGNNHEGDPVHARELVEAAMEAGADAIKMQIIDPSRLVALSEAMRIAQLGRYRLAPDVLLDLGERARARGCLFGSSVFDVDSLSRWLPDLDFIKVASGDLDFLPLLRVAAASNLPVVLSTGMSTLDEIVRAVEVFASAMRPGSVLRDRLAVLHCVSLYPTPPESANLAAIGTLRNRLGLVTGYSDHTLGIEVAVLSLALGARVVEKHFTINKNRSAFRDHALSADPNEFARLAAVIARLPEIIGDGRREAPLPDASTRSAARRGIVAARDLPAGTILTDADIDFVRPELGLPPSAADRVIGRRLVRALAAHQHLAPEDLA